MDFEFDLDSSVRVQLIATVLAALLGLSAFLSATFAIAQQAPQIESPDDKELFKEDAKEVKKVESRAVEQIMKTDKPATDGADFKAAQVEFLKEQQLLKGTGGVVISAEGVQLQADEGQYNTETKDTELQGNVLITDEQGTLKADAAKFNTESETGDFSGADFTLEDGAYRVQADRAQKYSETQYHLFKSTLSTCHCEDGSSPWCIKSDKSNITEEGYAHNYDTRLEMWDTPIMYLPWFAFPVKQERSSGLLVPRFGYSSEDGFQFAQPIFLVLDDYSDLTVTPFVETQTRNGSSFDYRHAFSRYNDAEGRLTYSNERPRDGDTRGTDTSDLFDPSIDDDRFGGYYSQEWRNEPGSEVPLSAIADVHYVSDDLYLREMDDPKIGDRHAQYTVSTVTGRAGLGSWGVAEASGEYDQSILTDDDLIFQRLPQLSVVGSRSVRPFGFNPYGFKLVPNVRLTGTDFSRKDGYDGWRYDVNPGMKIPFHFQNYVSNTLELGFHQTYYELNNGRLMPSDGITDSDGFLEESNDRSIFQLTHTVSTQLDRVYDLPADNFLTTITSLGSRNQDGRLQRLRHTIEPVVKFTYVPGTSQDDLPVFDDFDRIRERQLVSYGFRNYWDGRFSSKSAGGEEIAELTPEMQDLPTLDTFGSLPDVGESDTFGALVDPAVIGKGNIRRLATFSLLQTYNYIEDQEDNDPNVRPFSDVNAVLGLYPTQNFGLLFNTNVDVEEPEFSSIRMGTQFSDDRGDVLRAAHSFVDDSVNQIEGNIEIAILDRLKIGGYTWFDDREHEFIENRAAMRFMSSCGCWHFDVGFSDRQNPDKEQVFVTFTFQGLGDVTQNVGFNRNESQ